METVTYIIFPLSIVILAGLGTMLIFYCNSEKEKSKHASPASAASEYDDNLTAKAEEGQVDEMEAAMVALAHRNEGSHDRGEHGSEGPKQESDWWHRSQAAAMGIGTITLFLLQPTLVKKFALLFSCTIMGSDSIAHSLLLGDLSIQCYSSEHWTLLLGLGLPLFVLYVLGIPLAIYGLLSYHKHRGSVQRIQENERVFSQAEPVLIF